MAAALVALVLMGLVLTPGLAGAAEADPSFEARIDGGLDGYVVPGRPTPVRVTLTAGQLRSGELRVSVMNGPSEVVDFEVVGGSEEVHWMLLDLPSSNPVTLSASARMGGENVDLGVSSLEFDADSQLLGTLGGLSGVEPGEVETLVAGQRIHVIGLDPGVLDLGPNALAALDSIAVTPADVAGLSEDHRDAILGWLTLGGTLYVDAAPGTLEAWPEGLQPTTEIVREGAATIVSTGGALSEGRWSDVVLPAPSRSTLEDGLVAQGLPAANLQTELFGVDLGRDLPPLRELLWILALYTLLVGPIVYLLLRRRVMGRWIAIPALAVLATGVLFVRGGGPGAESTASVVDIIQTGPGPAMATSRVLLSTDVGDRHLLAPPDWSARAEDTMGMFQSQGVVQRRSGDGVDITIPALAGGVGTLSAQGPTPFEGALEVTATASDDGTVTGTVRNTTAFALDEVAVFFARTTATSVGTLEPGASAEFTLTGTNQMGTFGLDVFQQTWPDQGAGGRPFPVANGVGGQIIMGGGVDMTCDSSGNCFQTGMGGSCIGGECPSGPARPGSLSSAMRQGGANTMSYGIVTAVGWADDIAPVVDLGSDVDVVESRTGIVGQAVPTVPGDRLVDSASVRRVVAASSTMGPLIDITFSQALPTDVGGRPVDLDRLRMHLPIVFSRVEILTPEGPQLVRDLDPNDPGEANVEIEVPPEAVVGGRVLFTVHLRPSQPPAGLDMTIYEAAP